MKFGQEATFDTIVRGSPNPIVYWFINGQNLKNGIQGVKIIANNTEHKIFVDSSIFAGTVLCRYEIIFFLNEKHKFF